MDFEALADLALAARGITPSHPDYARYKAALVAQAQNESSVQGVWFAEDKYRYRQTLESQKQDIENRYKIAKAGVKNDRERIELDRWKAKEDIRLREADQAIAQGNLEVARGRLEVDRGAQGLDVLRTSVELGSQPRNWAKALDWRRGVAANPQAPQFLRSLLENAGARSGQQQQPAAVMAAPQGAPEPNSLAAVLAGFGLPQSAAPSVTTDQGASGGGTAAARDVDPRVAAINAVAKTYVPSDGDDYDAKDIRALRTIAAIARQGVGKTANRVAALDRDEQEFLAGGMDRLGVGGDWWLRAAEAKRYGGGAHSGVAV